MISKLPKWAADLAEKSGSLMPRLNISEITYSSPGLKRIRFYGDLTQMDFEVGFAHVIRVSDTEFRNYTPAFHDKQKGILELIFHIHGNGVGSRYIDNLKVGDELRISIPRGKKMYDPNVIQQFIFGDETSLGLACSLLPLLKEKNHQYQFYFELDEGNKNAPKLLGLENSIIIPKNDGFRSEKRLMDLPVFQNSDCHKANFILTGNVNSIQTLKRVLKSKNTGKILSQGYWLEGKKGL